MSKKITVLVGFNNESVIQALEKNIKSLGYEVSVVVKLTTPTIKEYLETHKDVSALLLREVSPEGKLFLAEEIASFTDVSDVNVVVVLSSAHKGSAYMSTLYAAGVTSALFEQGRRGASTSELARLCCEKRSRKNAREYYGIAEETIDIGMLSSVSIQNYIEQLEDKNIGQTIGERFLYISSKLSAKQAEDLIKRLPNDKLDTLQGYEEFYAVVDTLKKYGIKLPYKRPKNLKSMIAENQKKAEIEQKPTKTEKVKPSVNTKEESIQPDTNNSFSSLFEAPSKNEDVEEKTVQVEEKPEEIEETNTAADEPIKISKEVVKKEKKIKEPKPKKEKKVKVKKVKPEKEEKTVVIEMKARTFKAIICGIVLVFAACVTACGSDKDTEVEIESEPQKVSSEMITEESIAEENSVIEENVVEFDEEALKKEKPASNPSIKQSKEDNKDSKKADKENKEDAKGSEGATESTNTTTKKSSSASTTGVDSKTNLVVASSKAQTDYTYVAGDTVSSWDNKEITDGTVVTGVDVVNIINANTDKKSSVTNPNNSKVLVYVQGGASLSDIPATQQYKVTTTNEGYIFSLVE